MRRTLSLLFATLALTALGAHAHAQDDAPAAHAYDFHPAPNVIFADDFSAAPSGEFPPKWKLGSGQAVAGKVGGRPALTIIGTDATAVEPRIRQTSYLPAAFTVEFDLYLKPDAYGFRLRFAKDADSTGDVEFAPARVSYHDPDNNDQGMNLAEGVADENFVNRWHHIEVAVTNQQLKVYLDKARILYIPDLGFRPIRLNMYGAPSSESPQSFASFRLASGSGATVVGAETTDAHIVTHDINFPTGSAEITLSSAAEITRIAGILSGNSSRYEISGHTDNSGTPAKNLTLSQQRAEAVKAALVAAGIDASRLTTKGYGDTKALSPNTTAEGKANNRRVELNRLN